MLIHKKTLVGLEIDLFPNISFDIINNMVNYFKTYRCVLDFGGLRIGLILKRKQAIKLKQLFIIYTSPSSQDLVVYL